MCRLNDSEWQVLTALWDRPEGAELGQVAEALRPETGWSRNTVLTYLTRMEAKGLVTIDKTQAPHRYRAAVSREECAAAQRRGKLLRLIRRADWRIAVRRCKILVKQHNAGIAEQHEIAAADPLRLNGRGGQSLFEITILLVSVEFPHGER